MNYKIRKQESNKDFWFYLIFYIIAGIAIVLFFMFIIWIGFGYVDSYNSALNNCIDRGYSKEHCEYMLN